MHTYRVCARLAVALLTWGGQSSNCFAIADDVSPSVVTLNAGTDSVTFGHSLTLTAAVEPPVGAGSVTFYDGATVLGVSVLKSGTAVLNTIGLSAGRHFLRAFYAGDATHAAALSSSIAVEVNAAPATAFVNGPGNLLPAGVNPNSIAVADFNGDGKADLAVTNWGSGNVTVLLGNGDSTFRAAPGSPIPVVKNPWALAVGDFNGDGNPDLAVTSAGLPGFITVLLGDGTGAFVQTPGSPISVNAYPADLAVGDFNGDGRADLVVPNVRGTNVVVLLGDGSGGFRESPASPVVAEYGPFAVVVADFNGDGRADFAVTNSLQKISVLLGNGDGSFVTSAGSPFAVGVEPEWMASGDFNGDGIADLVVSNYGSNNVTILLGDGAGYFTQSPSGPLSVGTSPRSPAVADFNGDGNADLAIPCGGDNRVILFLGDGHGNFAPGVSPLPAAGGPTAAAVGDFNGDGRADLAVANYTANGVTVLLGVSAPYPSISAVLSAASFVPGVSPGSWITIMGLNLAPTTRTWAAADFSGSKLPVQLDGVSVTVNGKPAFVYFISPSQLNVLAPADSTTGPVAVQVTVAGLAGNVFTVTESPAAPALFTFYGPPADRMAGFAVSGNGNQFVSAVRWDNVYLNENMPAHAGDVILLFGTGFSPTNPPSPEGQILTQPYQMATRPTVLIGGAEATVQFAGLISPGLYQFNVVVPAQSTAGVPTGVQIVIRDKGIATQGLVFLTVQ
jgi:uncharacterized protein (TIGR03437 family)